MARDKMLSVITKDGLIDCPDGMNVYFDDIFEARKEGERFCQLNDYPYFVIRRIDSFGHYRTLTYRDKLGNKIK